MGFNNKNKYRYLLLLLSLILLSACAPKESSIEERVTARWNAIFSGDLEGAYEYLSPGYRSSVSSSQYQKSVLMQRVRWTSADYIDGTCDDVTCKVKINIGYTIHGALPGVKSFDGTQTVEESWVLVDGKWYMVPKQ